MYSDQGKIFIGGIPRETTEERLRDYFKAFGEVMEVVIMKDRITGRGRGFGFVVFADPAVSDNVTFQKHIIDGRKVEAKKALSRNEQYSMIKSNIGGHVPAIQSRTKKIFVGGLAPTVTENDFRNYFQQFGTITDVVVMYDHSTQRPRGFGFITYDSEDAVDIVVQRPFHQINGKMVEVKRSIPKEHSTGQTRRSLGGLSVGAGYGHAYNSVATGPYEPRMNSKYGPVPVGRGGYPSYGPSGYNASNYGNGGANVPGYGHSGGYAPAMNSGSYGNMGFGNNPSYGTSASGSYGTPIGYGNLATGGYGSNPALGRNVGGSGAMPYDHTSSSTGYGSAGNANMTSYSGLGAWGSGQVNNGQQRGNSAGYSSGYGSTENDYVSSGGTYPAQNTGYGGVVAPYGTYSQVAYSDTYGNSGYGDSTWRTNPPQPVGANSGGYGLGNLVADGLQK